MVGSGATEGPVKGQLPGPGPGSVKPPASTWSCGGACGTSGGGACGTCGGGAPDDEDLLGCPRSGGRSFGRPSAYPRAMNTSRGLTGSGGTLGVSGAGRCAGGTDEVKSRRNCRRAARSGSSSRSTAASSGQPAAKERSTGELASGATERDCGASASPHSHWSLSDPQFGQTICVAALSCS
jgi:hypothetical protein